MRFSREVDRVGEHRFKSSNLIFMGMRCQLNGFQLAFQMMATTHIQDKQNLPKGSKRLYARKKEELRLQNQDIGCYIPT
ncbi:unnamed protein product [Cuscuta campestris]|uniref:Uncharacterized protein n=1 Tax=Cuscuta campestris TaxID=132261 RepID=A0A484NCD2_9ASTE|nr:unnamed protein product [Cuscuta campestris]